MLGCGADICEEEIGVLTKPLERQIKHEVLEFGEIPHQHIKTALVEDDKSRGFNALNGDGAGPVGPEALYRCDEFVLKEELEGDFPGIAVKRGTQAPFLHKEDLARDFSFLQEGGFCANVDFGEQSPIGVPIPSEPGIFSKNWSSTAFGLESRGKGMELQLM